MVWFIQRWWVILILIQIQILHMTWIKVTLPRFDRLWLYDLFASLAFIRCMKHKKSTMTYCDYFLFWARFAQVFWKRDDSSLPSCSLFPPAGNAEWGRRDVWNYINGSPVNSCFCTACRSGLLLESVQVMVAMWSPASSQSGIGRLQRRVTRCISDASAPIRKSFFALD